MAQSQHDRAGMCSLPCTWPSLLHHSCLYTFTGVSWGGKCFVSGIVTIIVIVIIITLAFFCLNHLCLQEGFSAEPPSFPSAFHVPAPHSWGWRV